jgi:hypothetical protein
MDQTIEAVTTYCGDARGARSSGFNTDKLKILVTPNDQADNERAFEMACDFAGHAARVAELRRQLREANDKIAALRSSVPPKRPARLLAPGFVRFRGSELWLLGHRENGWSAFGFLLDDWDDLFRRYNVKVTSHGSDEHGAWWGVENA